MKKEASIPYSTIAGSLNYWLWRGIGRLAFNRIVVTGKESLPVGGPVLFVATHRNGALDAAPYALAAPDAVPMISAQLHRLPLGRFLFRGIAVARAKDKARGIKADNLGAVEQCVDVLKAGRQLFIMPEGTSTLGHRHLPFNRGAARIVGRAMADGITPSIVPLAVHYEDPTCWQSRAEVLIGEPIRPQTADEMALQQLISDALETVGANFADVQTQRLAEKLAYACTLGTDRSYARTLKSFERPIPPDLADAAHELEQVAKDNALFLHQGLPLVPVGSWPLYPAYWLILAPVILCFSLLNLPVLTAGYIAGRTLPDDANVVAFWRMAIGLPVALVWLLIVNVAAISMTEPIRLVCYWAISAAGIMAWYRFRKLSIALGNGLFRPAVKTVLLQTYRNLLNRMPHV
ncbi:MAG: 1-acyl-sn-glycerol-3-phosphate acyltransferase [Methylococcaceae bacterium]